MRCLLLCFLIFCVGCERAQTRDRVWLEETGRVKVLSTLAMIDDLVARIGGDDVTSLALIHGELDPHSYELVKGDDEKFAQADLIFYNGLGLEHGYTLRQNLEGNPKAVSMADPLWSEHPELILTVDGQKDPHIWMDIALWACTIDPIVEALAKHDPVHAEGYRARGAALREEMLFADRIAFERLQQVPKERRYLVTSHDAFHYFAKHYLADGEEWQARCAAPEGLAPEAQLSVHDLQEILDHVVAHHVPVLFPESNVSRAALHKIVSAAKEKGVSLRLCNESLYGDAMGKEKSYLEMMAHNVEVIARELNR